MTKKEQAMEIFRSLTSRGTCEPDRNLIIRRFQDALDMTKAGASTYYAMCKRECYGGTFQTQRNRKTTRELTPKLGTMYTVCIKGVNDDGIEIVDATDSYYDKDQAFSRKKEDEVVVKGLPELDSPYSELNPVK